MEFSLDKVLVSPYFLVATQLVFLSGRFTVFDNDPQIQKLFKHPLAKFLVVFCALFMISQDAPTSLYGAIAFMIVYYVINRRVPARKAKKDRAKE